ncbi:MAG: hypothetical protein KIT84_13510 [Labilithrix sp.]|nr:hypothetical protein [Labilithrix sp.]MCW5812035.1 hypothetical protein [Labilithrix sp.]
MLRHGVVLSVMTVLALLIGCLPPKDKGAAGADTKKAKRVFDGPLELSFVNRTKDELSAISVIEAEFHSDRRRDEEFLIATGYGHTDTAPAIPPGGSAKFGFKAGSYTITVRGGKGMLSHLFDYKLDVTGSTEIVIYDQDPPKDVPPRAGVHQIVVLSFTEDSRRKSQEHAAHAKAAREADYDRCKKFVAPTFEHPAAGKMKLDGQWTCVMGGGASGTNFVKLIQLADGKITATITGADRSTTWEGIVKGNEVRYRFSGFDATGGILKVDPGGRAMTGNGVVWLPEEGRCNGYTLTCTK